MKRLIVCCDGTWNKADQRQGDVPCPTNVLKIAFRISKRTSGVPQVVFYDQGVGTGNLLDRVTGGAFGDGLVDNIYDGYRFLIANYEAGDELFLFGFSRGAYTARSLCGMIRKCGILKRDSVMYYHEALELYRDPDVRPDHERARTFRKKHSVTADDGTRITFLGVWDTVGALGIPIRGLRWLTRRDHQFHDTELSGSVERAYQALAIDEHRGPFKATLWTYVPKDKQVVHQVWFCGAHSDVGGGYPASGLSDISLGWMIDAASSAGLAFDSAVEAAHPLKPNSLAEIHDSKKGMYRLTPGVDRTIGLITTAVRGEGRETSGPDATQSVHPSVLERWDKDASYRPRELRAFLERSKDPRVSDLLPRPAAGARA